MKKKSNVSRETLTDEQYAYCLTKNARVFYSTTGVFYEKAEEDSIRVLFKALKIGISNVKLLFKTSNSIDFQHNINPFFTKKPHFT